MNDPVLAYLIAMVGIFGLFALGAFIGDYVIPAIVNSIECKPQPKQQIDYARKEWIKLLSSSDQ